MRLLDMFRKNKANNDMSEYPYCEHEYCTYCYAALPLQKGYSNDLPYWICKGCGGMLINPEVPDGSSVSWICDECEAMLNIQPGFSDTCGNWQCTECGYINKIDKSEIYASDDEYRAAKNSPYKGLDEQILLDIMKYQELRTINDREDILLVQDEGKLYVKKILKTYDISVYKYLMEYPILHMPRIEAIYEGNKSLIVIEEYIQGRSLEDIIGDGPIEPSRAVELIRQLCYILEDLHKQKTPIIHRDIKPSNIIITDAGEL